MITLNATALRDAVAWLNRHTPRRPPHPILGAHVATFDGSTLALNVYDYETAARVTVDADGDALDGPLLVNGATLANITARLDGTVTLTPDEHGVQVRAGRHRFHLRALVATDYPNTPEPVPATGTIDADALADAVTRAACCLAAPDNALDLENFQIEATDTEVVLYATDRYRLSRCAAPWDGQAFDAMLPGRVLTAAVRDMRGTVTLGVDDNRVTLTDATHQVTITRSAAAPKTGVPGLIANAQVATEAQLPRQDVLDAVNAAQAVLEGKNPTVTFTFADAELTITAGRDTADSTTSLDVDDPDLNVTVIFPAESIDALLDHTPGDTVTLGIPPHQTGGLATKPTLVWGTTPRDEHAFLLMPIRKVDR